MTPRDFLKHYRFDQRLVTGRYYSDAPLPVHTGDTVGVVLLNMGGPDTLSDIEPFLYNLFMDPAIIDMPVGGTWRHLLSQFIARRRAKKVARDYARIGGGSPLHRLTRAQAEELEIRLNTDLGPPAGVRLRVYLAMRYTRPGSEDAARAMEADGVNKVVLLPLYPHFSKTTTGSSLQYWWTLEQQGEIPSWPTTHVFEYAAHPRYIDALNARIDEGLARFPQAIRDQVHLLFSAHGTPLLEMKKRRDPYCCLVHATVERVMEQRAWNQPYSVAFQSKVGPATWLTPGTPDRLKALAESGVRAVLLIPVAFVTDHIETLFELNILVREQAMEFGIEHYQVTQGLNCEPRFIQALAEAVAAQLLLPGRDDGRQILAFSDRPQYEADQRRTRCHQCEFIAEPVCWDDADTGMDGHA